MTGILISEPADFPEEAVAVLQNAGTVYSAGDAYDPLEISVVFVRLQRKLGPEISLEFPNLRYIVSPTTGLNHIDLEHFKKTGVEVISLRGRVDFLNHICATSEHTLAMALALIRKLPAAVQHTRDGGWDRYQFKGGELSGKRVLVLGFGRIGSQVARLYSAFGCSVAAHDADATKVPVELQCQFPEILAETDILSVHVDYTSETEKLVEADMLDRLPPSAIVVNTSRGEIVDQEALLRRLEAKRLGGAALDVLVNEPTPIDEELKKLIDKIGTGRLLITPHIGGFTGESLSKVERYCAELLIDRLLGATN